MKIDEREVRKGIAAAISNVANPFLLGVLAAVAISTYAAESVAESLKWVLVLAGLCILPVYLGALYLVKSGRMDAIFNNPRQQRSGIYITGSICAVITYIFLVMMDAPEIIIASLVTLILCAIIFMLVNLRWKISIHTASAASFSVLSIIMYGYGGAITLLLVPSVAWSRIELKQHSIGQVVAGTVVTTIAIVAIFSLYGVI